MSYLKLRISYDDAAARVRTAVWEVWTGSGYRMDEEDRQRSEYAVQEAVNAVYVDGIGFEEWQQRALDRLNQ